MNHTVDKRRQSASGAPGRNPPVPRPRRAGPGPHATHGRAGHDQLLLRQIGDITRRVISLFRPKRLSRPARSAPVSATPPRIPLPETTVTMLARLFSGQSSDHSVTGFGFILPLAICRAHNSSFTTLSRSRSDQTVLFSSFCPTDLLMTVTPYPLEPPYGPRSRPQAGGRPHSSTRSALLKYPGPTLRSMRSLPFISAALRRSTSDLAALAKPTSTGRSCIVRFAQFRVLAAHLTLALPASQQSAPHLRSPDLYTSFRPNHPCDPRYPWSKTSTNCPLTLPTSGHPAPARHQICILRFARIIRVLRVVCGQKRLTNSPIHKGIQRLCVTRFVYFVPPQSSVRSALSLVKGDHERPTTPSNTPAHLCDFCVLCG